MRSLSLFFLLAAPALAAAPTGTELNDAWLRSRLETRRASAPAPAWAAAVVVRGKVVASAAVGVRRVGQTQPVKVTDAFHIGSITKPVTGTLTGLLVERGVLRWNTRILEVFPELEPTMHPGYRDVTVSDLMAHVSGMPYQPRTEPPDEYRSVSKDLRVRRYHYVKSAVVDEPEAPRGTRFIYGGGSIIVAAMLEKLTGKSWEDLVRSELGAPLALTSLRFGASRAPEKTDAPWEHALRGDVVTAIPSPPDAANEVHAPAGRNVFLSVGDLARFAAAWLPSGAPALVSAELTDIANQPVGPVADHGVVWGLGYDRRACGRVFSYEGSNGQNWSLVWVAPQRDVAVVVEANLYTDALAAQGRTLIDDVMAHLEASGAAPCREEVVGASLTKGRPARASDVYGGKVAAWGPRRAVDGVVSDASRWATSDGVTSAWLEVDLGAEVEIGRLALFEAYGNRVEAFEVSVSPDSRTWTPIFTGTRIGPRLSARVKPVRARFVRLDLTRATNPTISEFAVYPP
ncbi:MAG: serine hydrolase [Myxococcaceae bacterium]|jgi:CubicO group peptidase (beta-lactamase class C family)|nr:serine hydrolase [Myxococcaceae bacterium]